MDSMPPGPPNPSNLIFIHGGGVGPWMWAEQVPFFSRSHQVHTPTLPGHDPDAAEDFSTHRAAAESVARQVGLERLGPPVTVIGFSLGGQVGIELAAAFPEQVSRLVVASSLVEPWPSAEALSLLTAASTPLGRNRRFARLQARQLLIPDEQFEAYFTLSRTITVTTVRRLIKANFSFSVPAPVLTANRPVLLMAGGQEQQVLREGMSRLAARLRDSTLEFHPGVAHGLPLERPDQFNHSLNAWLERTAVV